MVPVTNAARHIRAVLITRADIRDFSVREGASIITDAAIERKKRVD